MDTSELIPCPFCGQYNLDLVAGQYKYIHCNNCGADGPVDLGESGAVEAWNKRAQAVPDDVAKIASNLNEMRLMAENAELIRQVDKARKWAKAWKESSEKFYTFCKAWKLDVVETEQALERRP